MTKSEKVFCIIKFGKRKHLESILNKGELYFNKTENFINLDKFGSEQGDKNEGAEWILNSQFSKVKVNHPRLGEFVFKSPPNELGKLIQYNHNYLTCSFLILTTKEFEFSDEFRIDKKMLEFGSHALIIKKPQKFLDKLIKGLENIKLSYEAKKVEYKDLNTKGQIEINPFIKKIEHSYQKEFRIILKNQLEPKIIKISEMKKISELVEANYLIKSKWKVSRE